MASAHDVAEITRSASEAAKIKFSRVDLTRYKNPSANTCYSLEYAFYLIGNVRDKVVLDLGCGSGEEIVPLRQRGALVIGVDISPHLIAIAHERLRRYGLTADLRVGSAYETDLPSESVDIVFCMSLLHHLEVDRVKKEIHRILKPDGLFVVKEPIRFSRTMVQLRRLFPTRKEDVSEFEYPLSSEQVDALVQGFHVVGNRDFRSPFVPLMMPIVKAPPLRKRLLECDAWTLSHFPPLRHFATIRVMALRPEKKLCA